jgi:predicted dehydrogenase
MVSDSASAVAPVRWGILGAANIALAKVIPAMQRSALTPVVAIASRSLDKARAAAESLGIRRAYGSYEELITDPEIDAVYNPLPNHLHVEWSIRAARAGKHVLCEKPLALSAQDARDLRAVRDETGVTIGEAFMVRTHPQWLRVRELVADGRIGELRLVVGHFSYPRRPAEDIRNRLEWGGGALMDIGCYPITLSRWLYDAEPTDVVAMVDRDPDRGVDRLTSGLLRFPRGQASFTCSGDLVAAQRLELFGTSGRITVRVPYTPANDRVAQLEVEDGRAPIETLEIDPVDHYQLQGERFSEAIRGVGRVPVSLEDAIGNMAVIDALFRSAVSRRWESPAA